MSIFDNWTGGKSRKDILRASAEAEARLAQGRKAALGELAGGETGAKGYINQGYDDGRTSLNQGYDTARGDLNTQYGRAEDAINQALTGVSSTLSPFIQSGTWAQDLYDVAMGKGGAAASKDFYDNYAANDPYRAFRDEQANKQIQAQFNASGLGGSGRMGLAVSRASLERGSKDLDSYLDRLERSGARGGDFASRLAGYQSQAGTTIANMRSGLGDQLSGIEQRRGNIISGQDIDRGKAIADVADRYARGRADLELGHNQQLAGNRINTGSALAQTRSAGLNNTLGASFLGAAAASGISKSPLLNLFPGGSSTRPGTAANGGWTTTTKSNPLGQFANWAGV